MSDVSVSVTTPNTIYDHNLQNEFENWVIEAGIKIRFNTATYFVEKTKKEDSQSYLKKLFGIYKGPEEITTLHVVTNHPGLLIGKAGYLIEKYKEVFFDMGIDEVIIHEIRSQDSLIRGIKRKIKNT